MLPHVTGLNLRRPPLQSLAALDDLQRRLEKLARAPTRPALAALAAPAAVEPVPSAPAQPPPPPNGVRRRPSGSSAASEPTLNV